MKEVVICIEEDEWFMVEFKIINVEEKDNGRVRVEVELLSNYKRRFFGFDNDPELFKEGSGGLPGFVKVIQHRLGEEEERLAQRVVFDWDKVKNKTYASKKYVLGASGLLEESGGGRSGSLDVKPSQRKKEKDKL